MISICIITRDEQENLEACLYRLSKLAYEIIVVDTGSTDKTKDVAMRYTSNVYDFPWKDDFSAARNFCISKATKKYILMIDSDEYLLNFNKLKLEQLIEENPFSVGRIVRRNSFFSGDEKQWVKERIGRLFPKDLFCYYGRIHEQIDLRQQIQAECTKQHQTMQERKSSDNSQEIVYYNIPLEVEHVGYIGDNDFLEKKAQRNIRLLLKDLEEKETPYNLYQLGKSYYMLKDYEHSIEYFDKGLSYDLDPKLEYVIDMVETYGYALINAKHFPEALAFESIYETFGNRAEFRFLMGLIYMNNEIFDKAVAEFLKATEVPECDMEGINSYIAYYNAGVIYECLGEIQMAIDYYMKCTDYEKAVRRVDEIRSKYNNQIKPTKADKSNK